MGADDRVRKDVMAQVQHAGGDDVLLFAYVNLADVRALLDLADAARKHHDPECWCPICAARSRLDDE